MSMGYYDEILATIQTLLAENSFAKAYELIDQELKMPYVPLQFENELNKLKLICQQEIPDKHQFDLNLLEDYINGSKKQSLIAIDQLSKLNVRNYLDMISDFLTRSEDDSINGLLIDILIEQQINEVLTVYKDGLCYDFIPSALVRPSQAESYQLAAIILNNLLMSYPSLQKMAQQLLIEVFFKALPLSFENEESMMLALTIIHQVCVLMDDLDIYHDIVEKNNLQNVKIQPNIM